MATPREINLATKESIDLLFSDGIGPDAYMEPPKTIEELQAKGLLDETGKATSKGFLFTVLQEAGAIDPKGVLTPKALAYAVSPRDLQSPDNLWAFKQQWKDGILDGPEQTMGETVGAVADFATDAGTGLVNRVWQEAQSLYHQSKTWKGFFGLEDNRPEKLRREMEATGLGLAEGGVQAAAQTGAMAGVASAWLGDQIHDALGTDFEDEADEMLWTARQKQWSLNQDIQALEAGETAEAVLGMADAAETAAQAKEELGEEEFKKTYGQSLAAGQLFGSPENIATMVVSGGAATAATLSSRLMLKAQNTLGKVAQLDARIAAAEVALAKANNVIAKQSVWAAKPETAALAGRLAADAQAAIPRLTDELTKLTVQRSALATKVPEAAAQAFQRTIELGKQVKAAPANIVGGSLERIGSTMQQIDTGIAEALKSRGLDQLYNFGVGAATMAGLGGNPVFGAIATGAAALKAGRMIEQAGKFSKYVGKEMMQARGQVPFWKRVANHTKPGTLNSALAHAFNYADLAGVSSDILRRGARGVAAAAPVDLAFEYFAEGADMDQKTIQQSLAESLVLGGSTAALGGIAMGTKQRMKVNAIGDEINFRETLVDTEQKALFQALPSSMRRAVGTYSMANPNLKFEFTDRGGSQYDPATNTVSVNVTSSNPLKPLVAHEVLHHVVIKNQMEPGIAALFLGDTQTNTTGGLLRSKDGTLEPQFQKFKEEYDRRMTAAGLPTKSLEYIANEYFIEQHADQYADMAESGELGALASRTELGNKMRDIVNLILPKVPVLKDLHFKMGGQMDASGAMVMGNGLLAEGIRQIPAAQRMFRDMNRVSAGYAEGQFKPLGTKAKDPGVELMLDPNNPIDLDLLNPFFDRGPDGKPIPVDKATDLARSSAGLALLEGLRNKQKKNRLPEPGEMHIAPDGSIKGQWLDTETVKNIINQGKFNRDQIQNLNAINNILKTSEGGRMVMINFPALETLKSGKKRYRPKKGALRETVPVALTVTKDGNILVGLMSVTQLTQNIQKRAQSKRGKSLYGGNIGAITEDVREMMKAHKAGVDSIGYFTEKYGAVEAETRKKFINTLFGLMNKSEQAALNPMLLEDGVKSSDNVYKTYRLDRISKAVPLDPTQYPQMPFNYEAAKLVKMPEASMPVTPEMDSAYLEAVAGGDMETAQRMVNATAKRYGFIYKAFHGTSSGGFSVFDKARRGEKTGAESANKAFFASSSKNVATSYTHLGEGNSLDGLQSEFNRIKAEMESLKQQTIGQPVSVALALSSKYNELSSSLNLVAKEIHEARMARGSIIDSGGTPDPVSTSEVKSLFLKMDNPLVVDFKGETQRPDTFASLIEKAKKESKDGVIIKNAIDSATKMGMEPSDIFAFFDSNQAKSADPVTFDDAGNVIPLSERFNPKSADIRFMPEPRRMPEPLDGSGKNGGMEHRNSPVTPKSDSTYLEAIERGDTKTAQRMVDEIMANIPTHTLEFRNLRGGTELLIYGGDDTKTPKVSGLISLKPDSVHIETVEATSDGKGRGYGKAFYLAVARLAQENFKDYITGSSSDEAIKVRSRIFPTETKTRGDLTFSKSIVVPDLNFTPAGFVDSYDAQGNVIPLSERFNPKSADIRFMPEPRRMPKPSNKSLSSIRDKWKSDGIDNFVSENNGLITIHEIRVPKEKRNSGVGSQAMKEITQYADETGQIIALTPSTDFGASSISRLEKFYKRFGFKPNKGGSKDFTISESMIRLPNKQ